MSFRRVSLGMMFLLAMQIANTGVSSAAIIAQWTYEVNTPADIANNGTGPTVPADVGVGTGTAMHVAAATDWSTPAGNGSANSLSANEWAVGDYFQFEVSTLGLENITLAWDQTGSNTGPGRFDLEYRVGNTGPFTVGLDDYTVVNGSWNATTPTLIPTSYALDLSAITALNNQAVVQFRITMANTTSISGATVAAGGTGRVDNFTVNGVPPIPEPSTIALSTLAGLGLLGYRLRRKRS